MLIFVLIRQKNSLCRIILHPDIRKWETDLATWDYFDASIKTRKVVFRFRIVFTQRINTAAWKMTAVYLYTLFDFNLDLIALINLWKMNTCMENKNDKTELKLLLFRKGMVFVFWNKVTLLPFENELLEPMLLKLFLRKKSLHLISKL